MTNLVKGGGVQGFQDVILDEVHDLKMELSKKVRAILIYSAFSTSLPLPDGRGNHYFIRHERVRNQHFVDNHVWKTASLPAAGVPVCLRMHRQDYPIHEPRGHYVIHALLVTCHP